MLSRRPQTWTRHTIRSLSTLLGALALSALFAPACIGVTEGTCRAGQDCSCSGIGVCERTCVGPGCTFVCQGTGACEFDCPEGGCTAIAQGEGSAELNCTGNDCQMRCEGTGTCEINGCIEGCDVQCRITGTCS
jgi:hypothetical protein